MQPIENLNLRELLMIKQNNLYSMTIFYLCTSLIIWILSQFIKLIYITPLSVNLFITALSMFHLLILINVTAEKSGKTLFFLVWIIGSILLISTGIKNFNMFCIQVFSFSIYRGYFLHKSLLNVVIDLLISLLTIALTIVLFKTHFQLLLLLWSFFLMQLVPFSLSQHKRSKGLPSFKKQARHTVQSEEFEALFLKFSYAHQQAQRLIHKIQSTTDFTPR